MYQGSYHHALERALFKLFKITVRRSDWPQDLPAHLHMRFALFDDSGKTLATGRNLSELADRHRQKTERKIPRLIVKDQALHLLAGQGCQTMGFC